MLLAREVFEFDTGFGEPDGPDLALHGHRPRPAQRSRGDGFRSDLCQPGVREEVRLALRRTDGAAAARAGPQPRAALDAELAAISAGRRGDSEAGFGPLQAVYPTAAVSPQVDAARGVLGGGLLLFAVIAAAAGLLVTTQALARHAAAHAGDQRIESALGVVRAERVAARLLPALSTVVIAAGLAVTGVLVAGFVQPLGALRAYEPHVAWLPDPAVAVVGGLVTAFVVALLVAVTTVVAERRARPRTGVALTARGASWLGRPVSVLGASLAFGGRGSGSRGTVVTAVVAVAGVVATATFAASLHRVEHTPARYGWTADFGVADSKPAEIARFEADPRLRDVQGVEETSVRLGDTLTEAYALHRPQGRAADDGGRGPVAAGRERGRARRAVARAAGVETGDTVRLGPKGAATTVTGIVVVASTSQVRLGSVMVLTPEALRTHAESPPWTSAFLTVGDGVDANAVQADSAPSSKPSRPSRPPRSAT